MHTFDIKTLSQMILERLNEDYDVTIVITGDTGTGKSNLGISLMMELNHIQDNDTDLKNDIAFTQEDTIAWINEHNEKESLVIDEAVNVAYNRDFMAKGNRNLMKILDIMRSRNLVTIWCIPNFKSADNHLRGRCKVWIYVEKRGLGYVFIAPKNPAKADKWDLNLLEKLWVDRALPKYPCYEGNILFNKLPYDIEKMYNELKEAARDMIEKKELNDKTTDSRYCPGCQRNSNWRYNKRENQQMCRVCGYTREPIRAV